MKPPRLAFVLIMSLLMACSAATSSKHSSSKNAISEHSSSKNTSSKPLKNSPSMQPLALYPRLSWPVLSEALPSSSDAPLYSFTAKNLDIKQALHLFAKAYELNLLVDPDVTGSINVEFKHLSFSAAMQALLSSLGYYWQYRDNLLYVRSWQTQIFNIDYLRLQRSGRASSEAQISSGDNVSGSSNGDTTSSQQAGKIVIEQKNTLDFWSELEDQLGGLVSAEGKLVINTMAGTVQVRDRHPYVQQIKRFIDNINDSIVRQVDIQVKILEVTLNDDYSLGVDWSKILRSGVDSVRNGFSLNNVISSPLGLDGIKSPTVNLNFTQFGANGEAKLAAMVSALSEQGEVQIVSQPHIRTLNNQSALIKVGTDRTFFRRQQNTDNTSAGSNTTSSDVPQVVTEGIVLSLTPQISKTGWIMMDVSPAVTRVSSISEVKDGSGVTISSAPNLDVRQSASLVRAFNGETVVIGGLIQTQEADTQRGVPLLGRIPGFGRLFRGEYQSTRKKELVILLTPHLINRHLGSH